MSKKAASPAAGCQETTTAGRLQAPVRGTVCPRRVHPGARFAFGRLGRYVERMPESHTVVALRSALRRPAVVAAIFVIAAALVAAVRANSPWLLAFGLGALAGISLLLAWVNWPRKGELIRLVLDRPRRTLYWAHRGGEPEELPFPAVRAVAVEATDHPRYVVLWAVDTSGRWVQVGQGTRTELETFAREMANVMDVPLWYRDRSAQGPSAARSTLPPSAS